MSSQLYVMLLNRMIGKRRYDLKIWKTFCDVFNCLPPVGLVSDKIICMHGGLVSSRFISPSIDAHIRYTRQSPEITSLETIRRIVRPTEIPDGGLLCDILWSDPDRDVVGWAESGRGAGSVLRCLARPSELTYLASIDSASVRYHLSISP